MLPSNMPVYRACIEDESAGIIEIPGEDRARWLFRKDISTRAKMPLGAGLFVTSAREEGVGDTRADKPAVWPCVASTRVGTERAIFRKIERG